MTISAKKMMSEHLIDSICNGDIKRCEELLAQGADPNASLDQAAVTPLHFAAQNNQGAIIQLLLNHGANIHAKTHPDGCTPLDVATLHNNNAATKIIKAKIFS